MTPVIFVFLHLPAAHHRRTVPVAGRPQRDEPARAEASGVSLIMGAWFYMTAVGNFVAGKIGEATGGEGGEMTKELTLAIYSKIGWITIGVSVVVLALSPLVKKWMHLDTLKDDIDDSPARRELAEPQAAGMHPDLETAPRTPGA